MRAIVKRLFGSLLLTALIILVPYSGISFFSFPGVITAEAAAKKPALNKKKVVLAAAGKTTVQLKNINTKKKITWSSSRKSVAVVKKGSGGKATITAKKAGTATITAEYGGKKYTMKVTIKNPVLSKKSVTLTAGKKTTVQLKNIVSSKKISWISKKKSVATVKKGSGGRATITAKKKGTAYIYAKYNGKNYRIKVTVKAASPKLSETSVTVGIGSRTTISLSNAVSGKNTSWKSSKTSVAAIKKTSKNKITVTGKKAGKSTITAAHNGKKYKCTVTVKAQFLSKTSLSMTVGGSSEITLNYPVSGKKTAADSSDAGVAAVSVSGNNKIHVKAVGAGSAMIRVIHNGKTLNCSVKVSGSTIKPGGSSSSQTNQPSSPISQKPQETESHIQIGESWKKEYALSVSELKIKEGSSDYIMVQEVWYLDDGVYNVAVGATGWYGWTSSNPSVAAVKGTLVTGISAGKAVITGYDPSGKAHTCTVTVQSKPNLATKYSYRISILNPGNYTLYNKQYFCIYLQTDNPNVQSLDWSITPGNERIMMGSIWDDVQILSNESWNGFQKVSGGYLLTQQLSKSGTYTYTITERINGEDVKVSSITVTLQDYDADLKKWADSIVSRVTTSSMTDKEKVDAVRKYVHDFICYRPFIWPDGSERYVYLFKLNGAPWEIEDKYKRYATCNEANGLLEQVIVQGLGFKAEAFWLDTGNHVNTRVWIDEGIYIVDATNSGGSHFVKDCDLTPVI